MATIDKVEALVDRPDHVIHVVEEGVVEEMGQTKDAVDRAWKTWEPSDVVLFTGAKSMLCLPSVLRCFSGVIIAIDLAVQVSFASGLTIKLSGQDCKLNICCCTDRTALFGRICGKRPYPGIRSRKTLAKDPAMQLW